MRTNQNGSGRNRVYFGHNARMSVCKALKRLGAAPSPDALAYITSIDSIVDQKILHDIATRADIAPLVQHAFLCQAMSLFRIDFENKLFFGFDEIWFFQTMPSVLPLAPLAVYSEDFSNGLPNTVESEMIKSGCILLLGDGVGLNFATTDPAWALMLEEG